MTGPAWTQADYVDFFSRATGGMAPHPWQLELAAHESCSNRLVRIPTGFGKTLGVLLAWLYHAQHRGDSRWPRRLALTLPMRVLVEQSDHAVREVLGRLGVLWDGKTEATRTGKVGVHLLMGGANAGEWYLHPEQLSVLICTQDMALSRALNRGYAVPRARWPVEFGLLNQDTLWVLDEVQLMDVGLATSAQLQAFRGDDAQRGRSHRPAFSWWMSATLQPAWLRSSPDTDSLCNALSEVKIPAAQRTGALWDDVAKPCRVEPLAEAKGLAALAATEHLAGGRGAAGPTLIVVNRVERAVEIFDALGRDKQLHGTDLQLVHSRFRPHDRSGWRESFLSRDTSGPGTDRIIVATQVIEAGIDLSAGVLISDLAPWSSLVQRFGRCARWGGTASVIVCDFLAGVANDEGRCAKEALPYDWPELLAAKAALADVGDVAPLHLERFEEAHPERVAALYPYSPKHLVVRNEVEELFDTTPDLSGSDIDVSRFIRSGDERDVLVFWRDLGGRPTSDLRPLRDELCAAPFLKARRWLFGSDKPHTVKQSPGRSAWVWSWTEGSWRPATARDVYPGQVILASLASGGYSSERGFHGETSPPVTAIPPAALDAEALRAALADDTEDGEDLSARQWQTIATHNREVGKLAAQVASELSPLLARVFDLGGRWHDAGKAHPAFRGSIITTGTAFDARPDLAKAPQSAWRKLAALYPIFTADGSLKERRRGFRHELASTLMLFDVLRRHAPDHPALLGPWRELFEQAGWALDTTRQLPDEPTAIEREIMDLSADDFDLLAYLVCCHHGKVRMAWHASPADQGSSSASPPIRGVVSGDVIPPILLAAGDGTLHELPESVLDLAPAAAGLNRATGMGWTERVLGLLERFGPFTLAWLEALIIGADRRASRLTLDDPLLRAQNEGDGLETSRGGVARAAGSGEAAPAVEADPRARGSQHGLRGRAGEPGDAGGGSRAAPGSTRLITTQLGTLTFTELAPHVAQVVQQLERAITGGELDGTTIDDSLIVDLHRRLCAELMPDIAGLRRSEVTVGSHSPPSFVQVPILLRDYARDVSARVDAGGRLATEALLETLAFAEGRLLSIHPFTDFNGRVTRLFLRLLLRRLDLPDVALAADSAERSDYLAALRAADTNDFGPLTSVWRARLAMRVGP